MALDEVKLVKEQNDGTFTEDLSGAKLPAAVAVPFDNTGTSLAASTVQAALAESEGRIVAAEGAIGTLQTSVADILSGSATAGNATLLNGNNSAYYLNRANHTGAQAADTVSYDNTISGLVATDVKAAIDEIAAMGGGGATQFTQLTDVPASYTGQSLKAVRVNAGETGLEFFTISGGGGTERQFIYRPLEVSPSGNVYNDLALLLTAAQAVNGKKLILVDITAHQVVPSATYNFADCTIVYANPVSNSEQYELRFAQFTQFSALPDAIGVAIRNEGLSFVHTSAQTVTNLRLIEYGRINKFGAAGFARANTSGHILNIYVSGIAADIVNTQGITGVFNVATGATINCYVDSLSANTHTTPNLFGGSAGGTVNYFALNGKRRTGTNAAYSGTVIQTVSEFRSRFTNLADAPISFAGEALKALRVNAAENAIEFYTPSSGGAHNVFFFDPNVVTPEGNLFNNFDNLMTAISGMPAANEKAIIYFDLGGAGYSIPTVQPYDFRNCIFKQWRSLGDTGGALQFPDGCEIVVFPIESEINFEFNNTTIPVSAVSGGGRKETTFTKSATVSNYGTQPVFQTDDTGSIYEITLKDLCNWNTGTIFKNNNSGSSLIVNLFGGARIGNVFDSVALSTITIVDSTLISNSNAPSSYGAGSLSYTNEYESRVTQLANSIATPNWIKLKTGFEYNLMGDRSIANLIEVGPSAVFGYTTGGTLTARSVNNGVDWQNAANVSDTGFASVMTISSTHYVVRCSQSGNTSSYSTDVGATWNTGGTLPSSGSWLNTVATTVSGVPRIIATKGASTESAYTTDGGVTWIAGGALPSSGTWRLISTVVSGTPTVVAVKESSNESAYSTDGGATWTAGGTLPASGLYALCSVTVSGTPRVVAVQSSSTASAYSTDGGATWIAGGTVNTNFSGATKSIIAKDGMVFAILGNGVSVVKSINGGVTWVDHGKLTNSQHANLYIFQNAYGSYLYASGNVAGGTAMYLN